MTRYEVLPPPQRRLLPTLAPLRDLDFVLYGGTAIALQIGHRSSIDFDFFTDRPLDRTAIREGVPSLASTIALQDEPQTWTLLTSEGVKLSFFGGLSFGRVGLPIPTAGGEMLVASLADLLGHKLKVLLQSVEAKDYRDIAALLRHGSRLGGRARCRDRPLPSLPAAEAVKAGTSPISRGPIDGC